MTKEYEQVHMAQTASLFLEETKALQEAITKHYISPKLMRDVLKFAAEQDLHFTKYVPSSGLFFLSDGEGYSAKAVLEYFDVDTSRLVLPTAVDDPIETAVEGFVIHLSSESYGNSSNDYGYWTGKVFTGEDLTYPGYEDDKTHNKVKVYKSKRRAEIMAEKLENRCTYVFTATVETL